MYIKKTLSFLLVLALTVTAVPALGFTTAFAEDSPFTYEIDAEKTAVTITGCDPLASGNLAIPETIEDLPVTGIGSMAFAGCASITGITLPDGITRIGNKAFLGCDALTSILIPENTAEIGYFALGYKEINVPQEDFILFCFEGGKGEDYADANALSYEIVPLTNVTVKTLPLKTEYIVGESFDPSGLELTVIDHAGIEKTAVSGYNFAPATFSEVGEQTVVITYGDRTVPVNVTVTPTWAGIIVAIPPTKTDYFAGDTLNTEGLYLLLEYSQPFKPKVISDGFTCDPMTLTTAGTQEITVTYKGFQDKFTVTVKELLVTELSLKTSPNKLSYYTNQVLDTTGLSLTAVCNNGSQKTITSGFTFSPTKLSTPGIQEVTVTYQGLTETFFVTVTNAPVSSIKLNKTSADIAIGSTLKLTPTVSPAYATNKSVSWTSGNTAVATVSSTGVVTGKAAGSATITCKAKDGSGKTAKCSILVYPNTPASAKAVSASYNSIKLSWQASPGASGYRIYRATSASGSYSLYDTTIKTSYTNMNLTTGKTYYYVISAYTVVGDKYFISDSTAILSAKPVPATPGSFTAAKASSTSIKLSWKAVSGASGYAIYRATSSTGTFTYEKSTTALSITNTGLTKNKTYYYKIRAYRTVNNTKVYGAYTAVKSAKPY